MGGTYHNYCQSLLRKLSMLSILAKVVGAKSSKTMLPHVSYALMLCIALGITDMKLPGDIRPQHVKHGLFCVTIFA